MATKKSSKKPAAKAVKQKCEKPEAIAAPGADSKASKVLHLIARPEGASIEQIMEATGWNANSVRGFLSTAAKKRGLKIEAIRAPMIYRLKTEAVKTA
jgi:hypothetical protein